jgi:hypothetical protein
MHECKHNRIAIWESTEWAVDRERKTVDIRDEEFDFGTALYCLDCLDEVTDVTHQDMIDIIEKSRGNT